MRAQGGMRTMAAVPAVPGDPRHVMYSDPVVPAAG